MTRHLFERVHGIRGHGRIQGGLQDARSERGLPALPGRFHADHVWVFEGQPHLRRACPPLRRGRHSRPRRHAQRQTQSEMSVQIAQRCVLAALRHHTFFTLADLNAAIRVRVAAINERPMKLVGVSRRALFGVSSWTRSASRLSMGLKGRQTGKRCGFYECGIDSGTRGRRVPIIITL